MKKICVLFLIILAPSFFVLFVCMCEFVSGHMCVFLLPFQENLWKAIFRILLDTFLPSYSGNREYFFLLQNVSLLTNCWYFTIVIHKECYFAAAGELLSYFVSSGGI